MDLLVFILFGILPVASIVAGVVLGRRAGKTTAAKVYFSILWSLGLLVGVGALCFGACMCIFSQMRFNG